MIESANDPLQTLPQKLSSVADVMKVIKALESFRFCLGNEGDRFDSLIGSRKGQFKDSSGNINLTSVSRSVFDKVTPLAL